MSKCAEIVSGAMVFFEINKEKTGGVDENWRKSNRNRCLVFFK